MKKINIALAGATGFVGLELLNILQNHPNVKIVKLYAQSNLGKPISFFDKRFKKNKFFPKVSLLKARKDQRPERSFARA